jgi:hypothetical protein
MEMWSSSGRNIANEEWRALATLSIRGVVQCRCNRHAPDRPYSSRVR